MTDDYEPSDFEYVSSEIGWAFSEGMTNAQILMVLEDSDTGEDFDAGVTALVDLKYILGDVPTDKDGW